MKKIIFIVLILLNIGFVLYAQQTESDIDESITLLSNGEFELVIEDLKCISGGPGSAACDIAACAAVKFSCGVNCTAGYYACCGIEGCHCKPRIRKRETVE